jgi:hypothetical protein
MPTKTPAVRTTVATPPTPSRTAIHGECEAAYAVALESCGNNASRSAVGRVYDAVCHLVETRSTDFGYANVARVVQRLYPGEAPKTQSIMNEGGKRYRRLIDAFERAYTKPAAAPGRPRSEVDDLVASIRDQVVATRVREMDAEIESLTKANRMLKKQFDTLKPVDPRTLLSAGTAPAAAQDTAAPALPTIHPWEAKAVSDFLKNATNLLECAWDEETGALLASSGMRVTGRGFRQVLTALLDGRTENEDTSTTSKRLPATTVRA